jgi:hypothetical protein
MSPSVFGILLLGFGIVVALANFVGPFWRWQLRLLCWNWQSLEPGILHDLIMVAQFARVAVPIAAILSGAFVLLR